MVEKKTEKTADPVAVTDADPNDNPSQPGKGQNAFPVKERRSIATDYRFTHNIELGQVTMRDGVTGLEVSREFKGKFEQGDYDEMKSELKDKEHESLEREDPHAAGSVLPGLQTKQSREMFDNRNKVAAAYPATAGQTTATPATVKTELPDPSVDKNAKREKDKANDPVQPGQDVDQRRA